MALIGHGLMMKFVKDRRIVHVAGRFGGGKTSFAFRLAYEFLQTGEFRYLLSNVKSVWNDDPEQVVLRDGKYVDAVVILDEAGEFMATKNQVSDWMSYLRKQNIILILPSFEDPARSARALTIERTWDGFSIGLPLWHYRVWYDSGRVSEKMSFKWLFPQEVYGIYDTDGYPADEAESLLAHLKRYTGQAASSVGYKVGRNTTGKSAISYEQSSALESIERAADDLEFTAKQAQKTISVLEGKKNRRRK